MRVLIFFSYIHYFGLIPLVSKIQNNIITLKPHYNFIR